MIYGTLLLFLLEYSNSIPDHYVVYVKHVYNLVINLFLLGLDWIEGVLELCCLRSERKKENKKEYGMWVGWLEELIWRKMV